MGIGEILLLIARLAQALAPILSQLGQAGVRSPSAWTPAELPADVQADLRRLVGTFPAPAPDEP